MGPQFLHHYFPLIFFDKLWYPCFINRLKVRIIDGRFPFLYVQRPHRVASLVFLSICTCNPLELLNLNYLSECFLYRFIHTHIVPWMILGPYYFSFQGFLALMLFLIQMEINCGTDSIQCISLLQLLWCRFEKRVDWLIIFFAHILHKSTVVSELWLQLLL